jgi:hypothetical protein
MTTTTSLPELTEAQEEVLCLIGHDEARCIDVELQPALDELFAAGLVTYSDPDWSLTSAGRFAFDRLCLD